jgi:hypothetical protein
MEVRRRMFDRTRTAGPIRLRRPVPLRQVHLDFHTPGVVRPIAEAFDAAAFAATMRDAHVQSVNVFARCHHGYSYHPTKVGTTHPGLGFDLLGEQVKALHRAGIRAIGYVTIGWDDLAAENHPEWISVRRDGTLNARKPFAAPSITGGLSPEDRPPEGGPGAARWSYLDASTPYGEYVLEQTRELCRGYDLDGFWFDICLAVPNYSPWGMDQMERAGVDAADDPAAFAFARDRQLAYLSSLAALVERESPGADVFFNGTTDAAMGETVGFQTHLDVESLPTSPGLWGYLHYPIAARQARTYGLPFLGMTGRFHKSWADFGGIKTADQLDYEAGTIMSAGGGVYIGDQLHPSGALDPAVYRLIGHVFERMEKLEPWLLGARSEAEVALISDPRTESFGGQPATAQNPDVEGAAQLFLEIGVQFDVVDAGTDLTRYRLVVLPDGLRFDEPFGRTLEAYVAGGGKLMLSGTAGLGPEGFTIAGMPVEYLRPAPTMPCYFRVDQALAAGSELATDYDYVFYDQAVLVRPKAGSMARGSLSASLFDRTWQHFFSHAQSPVGPEMAAPLAVIGGNGGQGRIAYLAAPLFRAYRDHDYWAYREVVRSIVDELLPDPIVRFDGPPWIEVGVLGQPASEDHPARLVVHLVAYHPRRTMQEVPHVDASWPVAGTRLGIRVSEHAGARCYLAPGGRELPHSQDRGYVWIDLPNLDTHTVVVVEPATGL